MVTQPPHSRQKPWLANALDHEPGLTKDTESERRFAQSVMSGPARASCRLDEPRLRRRVERVTHGVLVSARSRTDTQRYFACSSGPGRRVGRAPARTARLEEALPHRRPGDAVVGRDLRGHARAHPIEHGRAAAFAQSHRRLLGRDADDHDRVAARPAVLAARLVHAAFLHRRLHLSDHHLGGLRLRVLLEGAGKPLRGLALGDKRRRPGAVLAARRLDAARAAAVHASATLGHLRA